MYTQQYHQHVHKYGCASLILDVIMLCLTCGLWGIWILIRQARRR